MEASALRAPAGPAPRPVLLRLRSDDQLVALFRLGSEEAFRTIHDRYRARMLAYTRQMLGASGGDAEDALQDVFMRAYHALRSDDRPVTLRAWLYRVAHNRCVDHLRRPTPVPANVVELFDAMRQGDCTARDPSVEFERREDLRRLVADVQRLPDQQRSALLMRELEGLSYNELADALEVSVPAVKSLLVRARMGLVDARLARDTACTEIRAELAGAYDRGVRASGRARRHIRECQGCKEFRAALRSVERGVAALAPSTGPWASLAKLFGGGGAAAGGGAAIGSGGAAAVGGGSSLALGGAAAVTTAKVAAVVCCAALVGGGAVEATQQSSSSSATRSHHAAARAATAVVAARPVVLASAIAPAIDAARLPVTRAAKHAAATHHVARHTVTAPDRSSPGTILGDATGAADAGSEADHEAQAAAGGMLAPVEDTSPDPAGDVTSTVDPVGDQPGSAGQAQPSQAAGGAGAGDSASTAGTSAGAGNAPSASGASTPPPPQSGTGATPAAGSGGTSPPPGP